MNLSPLVQATVLHFGEMGSRWGINRTVRRDNERHAQARLKDTHEVIELLCSWYGDVRGLVTQRLVQRLTLGAPVQKVLEFKDRLTLLPGRRHKDDLTGDPATTIETAR